MKDILRCAKSFPAFQKALSVDMIELSEFMRKLQKESLESYNIEPHAVSDSVNISSNEPKDNKIVIKNSSHAIDSSSEPTPVIFTKSAEQTVNPNSQRIESFTTKDGVSVQWYSHLKQVPVDSNVPFLFIGQEFLDVFPVHHLVKASSTSSSTSHTMHSTSGEWSGWCEKLVDVDSSVVSPYHFRMVLSPGATPATRAYIPYYEVHACVSLTFILI